MISTVRIWFHGFISMKKYLPAICCLLVLSSCGHSPKNNEPLTTPYSRESFPSVVELKSSLAVKLTTPENPLILGLPHIVRLIGDKHLVLVDAKPLGKGQLLLFDLDSCSVVDDAAGVGRGPGESLSIINISVDDNSVCAASVQGRKLMRFSVTDSLSLMLETVFKDGFMKAVPLGDSSVFALSAAFSGRRMDIRHLDGEIEKVSNAFPMLKDSPSLTPDNSLLQGDIAVSPDGNHIVVACKSFEYIDIFDEELNLTKRLSGPEGVPQRAEIVTTSTFRMYRQEPMYMIHNNIVAGNDGFMVGYIGKRIKSPEDLETGVREIFYFNWKGSPMVEYKLDVEVLSFDVDWDNKRLYCLTKGNNPELLYFNL